MEKEFSRDSLHELASEIADLIVSDPSISEALAGLAFRLKCPPRQLCCHLGYACNKPFVCRPGFDCTVSFVTYPWP